MHPLELTTLLDIKRHKNEVLRLASFFSQSDSDIFTDFLSKLNTDSSESELMIAFEKDVNKTATFIEKASTLLITTDSGGNIVGAEDTPNVKDIFGSNYNTNSNTINLGNLELDLSSTHSKEKIKELLILNILGISVPSFTALKKLSKKVFTLSENNIHNEEDALQYLAQLPLRKKHMPVLDKINSLLNEFNDTRKSYSKMDGDNIAATLNLIDREIIGTRAMIDSVTQASSHITNKLVLQTSNKHKAGIQELQEAMKANKYLSDVEVDSNADITKITNLVEQIKDLELNINDQFTLKARKLGNYKAHGLCMPSMNIVAIDIRSPSSLIHELTHLVDLTNKSIFEDPSRIAFIDKYRDKIDQGVLPPGMQGYFACDNEIIARMGEISYLLKLYDYQGENFNEFTDKVRKEEGNISDICVVKSIDSYLQNSNIYFGIGEKLTPEDLLEIKSFYSAYWGIGIKPVNKIPISITPVQKKSSKYSRSKEPSKFIPTSFSDFTDESVVSSYLHSKNTDLINPDLFVTRIVENMKHLHRNKKRIRGDEVIRQFNTVTNLISHVFDNEVPLSRISAFISLIESGTTFNFSTPGQLAHVLKGHPNESVLLDSATNISRNGYESISKRGECSYEYLNSYGQDLAEKNSYLLQIPFLKSASNHELNAILDDVGLNSRAYYETVFMRAYLVKDDKELFPALIEKLKKDDSLALFSNQNTIFLANSLGSKFRKLARKQDLSGKMIGFDILDEVSDIMMTPATEWQGIANSLLGINPPDSLNYFAIDQDNKFHSLGAYNNILDATDFATRTLGSDVAVLNHIQGQELKSIPFNTDKQIGISKTGEFTIGEYPHIMEGDNPPTIVVDSSEAIHWHKTLDDFLPKNNSAPTPR